MAASVLSNILGIRGPTLGYISACNTGLENILRGVELIKSNRVRVVLAGASEACLTPLIIAGFQKLGVLAKERFSPFDKEREGFFLGEGAGVVVLEKASSALARGAKIQAEVLAGVSLGEAYHITSLSLRKNILTVGLRKILKETQLNPMEVDYINVHGTATPANDLYETEAIKDSFGETAYQIKISATKPYTGHLLGASGVLEVIICLLALKESFLPQTPNYRVQDPRCDLNYLISGPIFSSIKITLSISLGFGGHTGIIALKKWEKS
jgi:3-oxoacyl-[acyl-carrier-protein] synthase II